MNLAEGHLLYAAGCAAPSRAIRWAAVGVCCVRTECSMAMVAERHPPEAGRCFLAAPDALGNWLRWIEGVT